MSFYYRPYYFPPVIKNLIIINILLFFAHQIFANNNPNYVENLFALHDVHSVYFRPHQLITYMFMHGSIEHVVGNMLGLWIFGSMLESHWGSKRFLQFYFITGISAGLLHLGVLYMEMQPVWEYFRQMPAEVQREYLESPKFKINIPTVGASGAVFGVIAGAGYLFPNVVVMLFGILPVKILWLSLFYIIPALLLAIQNSAGDNVAHFAHLGGAAAGIIVILIWNKTNRKTLY